MVVEVDAEGLAEELWQCPSCGVSGAHTDLSQRGFYGLQKPCPFKSTLDCWCEAIVDQQVCRLCLRMYRDKHKRRGKAAEQSRSKSAKRRASFSAPDNAKRARSDAAASQSSSALVLHLQRDERSCDGSIVSI